MSEEKREIFVGIDLHKRRWHVTFKNADVELFSGGIPDRWESLRIENYQDELTGQRGYQFCLIALRLSKNLFTVDRIIFLMTRFVLLYHRFSHWRFE